MIGRFFVTGLPRSRTAWMAAYLSTGRSLCYHEPMTDLQQLTDLIDLYEVDSLYNHVGVSDSGLGFQLGWMLNTLHPRTLMIQRPLADVEQSLAALGFPRTNQAALLQRELDRWADHPLVHRINYSALDNPRAMEKAWFHLLPGMAFDAVRHAEFCKLNIQADLDKVRQRVAANPDGLRHTLTDFLPRIRPVSNS